MPVPFESGPCDTRSGASKLLPGEGQGKMRDIVNFVNFTHPNPRRR